LKIRLFLAAKKVIKNNLIFGREEPSMENKTLFLVARDQNPKIMHYFRRAGTTAENNLERRYNSYIHFVTSNV
jgi:hypothetical protein